MPEQAMNAAASCSLYLLLPCAHADALFEDPAKRCASLVSALLHVLSITAVTAAISHGCCLALVETCAHGDALQQTG
jgi:hypothetical protein